ncbi:MAG: TetR family transcriptional regulator [Puniceicoccaceae bacterium 5H]|nr:MAG: TetR family transcriptional regulator [Puniceicoccaceae bacterium 5H]
MQAEGQGKKRNQTRDKLLAAAATVFVREGLAGATTRLIAREAGVNEVTLFRHFRSKDRLLAEVVGTHFDLEALSASVKVPAPTGDLRADLIALGTVYAYLLQENLPLIRTMLGETQHDEVHERKVFRAIFRPLKEARSRLLERAAAEGRLRTQGREEIFGDFFTGSIFSNVLKRSNNSLETDYPLSEFVEFMTDLILSDPGEGGPARGA